MYANKGDVKSLVPYEKIISYLNKRTSQNYRFNGKKTRRHILARWAEGFSLEDFYYVIDVKTQDWGENPEFRKYLRPETLFGPKFESYLNQTPVEKQLGIKEYLRDQGFNPKILTEKTIDIFKIKMK